MLCLSLQPSFPQLLGYHTALAPALNRLRLSKTQWQSLKNINGTRKFPLGAARTGVGSDYKAVLRLTNDEHTQGPLWYWEKCHEQ